MAAFTGYHCALGRVLNLNATSVKDLFPHMNYEVLMLLWEESLKIVKETEMRSRISGIAAYMQSFDFFFGVVLSELILHHSDNLSKTLQSPKLSAAEGQGIDKITLVTLQ